MAFRVKILSRARENIGALDVRMQERVMRALVSLENFLDIRHGVKKLRSPLEGYRFRVGEYRILFTIEKEGVIVRAITHRKDVYR